MSHLSVAQQQLLELALSRKAIPNAKAFLPLRPWNVPAGVNANEAVKAGIDPLNTNYMPASPNPYTGSLVLISGKPCIYGGPGSPLPTNIKHTYSGLSIPPT